ncbi:MAG: DNA translocase FtsK [Synergistaceae bacterium]|jgi:S-DNA-T family DNA segregation ATPase FtsK/SpoIIIE|nr:DNA translocase FtsK [Synergistaceae bacterium]
MTAKRISRSKSTKKSVRDDGQGKFKAGSVESFGSQKDSGVTRGRVLRERPGLSAEAIRERVDKALVVLSWLALSLDVFLTASVFTNWMGLLGTAAAGWLLDGYGAGALIIVFFTAYLSVSKITGKKIPKPLTQAVGTLLLYFCATLLLGLLDLAFHAALKITLVSPGSLGRAFSVWSFKNLGPLGTTLLGFSLIALAMHCFGITAPFNAIRAAVVNFKQERARVASKRRFAPEETTPEFDDDDEMSENEEYDDEAADEDAEEIVIDDIDEPTEDDDLSNASNGGFDDDGLPSPVDVLGVEEMDLGEEISAPAGRFPPPVEIFGRDVDDNDAITEESARPWGERIIDSLAEFGIEAELAEILMGPTVIQFRIHPSPGVKVRRIVDLQNDLAMALAVSSLRVEAPIPGKPYVGIEIPNPKRRGITLRSVIEEDEYQNTTKSLPLPMGMTINGEPLIVGLEELPHLLVAGTTGSGKSVFVNSCIVGLCSMRRPDELKMVMVDPKRVEMAAYEKLPHILTPPVTDPKKAVHVLGWAVREMERRYLTFAGARVKNLAGYNERVLPKDRLPHIVIVVDELADLMMTAAKEVEEYICRLAQMARATGLHLMLATQRPSVNVVTGLIKSNIPARVAFTLPSMMDSRTILDTPGAEKLLGRGDMLFLSTQNPKPIRVQSPWIDERSVARWIEYLINTFGEPIYVDLEDQGDAPSGFEDADMFNDALLEEAVHLVMSTGMASASSLQRRLRVGFTRAGRLVDMMEKAGVIGPADGARPREILVDADDAEEILGRLRGSG